MTLYAKSSHGTGEKLPLTKHTLDVCDTAALLFGSPDRPTRLGVEWLRFFKLLPGRHGKFCETLEAAAAFHDWGKANQGFQEVLDRRGEQPMRHEHLSTLMLASPTVWESVRRSRADLDWEAVLAAVVSHHMEAAPKRLAEKLSELPMVRVFADDQDFHELQTMTWRRLRLGSVPPTIPLWWTFDATRTNCESIAKLRQRTADILDEFDIELEEDESRRRLLWAVRAALIVADGVASGLRRTGESIGDWIATQLDRPLCEPRDIENIINQRQMQLEDAGKWRGWSEFQTGCETKSSRTLLLAPCGSGKTLAAWRWILARVRERPAARVIFLYPTRAAATEGFRDYLAWAPEADAGLIHGTAGYELSGLFDETPLSTDPRGRKDFQRSVDPRLFAFGYWSKRIFSATVDQFLAFLQYAYGPTCLLPVLADSVVVIDEVHSFDEAMFSALKTLLKEFDLPVLCMTATLPPGRIKQLREECDLEVYNDKPGDLSEIAKAPRYIVRVTSEADARSRVAEALAEHKRVLWVVNLVRRAQHFATEFGACETSDGRTTATGQSVLCYHSRFTLDDRKKWHGRVVEAFQDASTPRRGVLAVTTQVCEMSLDLDADVLVTEFAPVTALIQRMGRCNRKTKLPLETLGEILVYQPDDPRACEKPYDAESLLGVPEFIARLTTGPVSQVQLEEALRLTPQPRPHGDRLCQFTTSGPYADSRENTFRDIDEFSRPGVLDVEEYLAASLGLRPGLIVPVPKHFHFRTDSRLPRYLVVAPAGVYDAALGLRESPRN